MSRLFQISISMLVLLILQTPIYGALQNIQLHNADINGVNIAWAEIGDTQGPPLIMVTGLACSHKVFSDGFINGLAQKGYRIILLDNRDVGASQRFYKDGAPSIWWNAFKNKVGLPVSARYDLFDMASDVVGLMDMLQIDSAHILGGSMGGMIAQIVAAQHPDRTRSLISIMSTTNAPHLPPPANDDTAPRNNLDKITEQARAKLREKGFFPDAVVPHLLAIVATGDRSESVASIKVDTLVIHGSDDQVLPLAHGEHTAKLITNSTLVVFDGMAHDIPKTVLPNLLKSIYRHVHAVEQKLLVASAVRYK